MDAVYTYVALHIVARMQCVCMVVPVCIGVYFTGDGALRDEDGLYRITGRVDDIIMSKGHRIGTAELECAMVSHHTGYSCTMSARGLRERTSGSGK